MNDLELWKMFEKTGDINDYLNYACTCEHELEDCGEELCNSDSSGVEYFE